MTPDPCQDNARLSAYMATLHGASSCRHGEESRASREQKADRPT
jgi:hypothetical protein